jgi:hypothetical protein
MQLPESAMRRRERLGGEEECEKRKVRRDT